MLFEALKKGGGREDKMVILALIKVTGRCNMAQMIAKALFLMTAIHHCM